MQRNNLKKKSQQLFLLLALGSLFFSGCSQRSDAQTSTAPPPPEVGVVVVKAQRVAMTTELPGRITPYLIAEVRPQVSGIIQERTFSEGSEVREGEVLYRIDPARYQAVYDSAAAELARAEARLVPARLKMERFRELVGINAVSQQDYDDASAALKLAEADLLASRADLASARIDLDYTKIKAPISGRIGRSQLTTGALVTASQALPLATIQQLDPIYVDLTQTSSELLRLQRQLANGELERSESQVRLVLEDGSDYPETGSLKFSEVTVTPGTGSVTLRTLFPNKQQQLLPGMYVRAVLEEGIMKQAILVPQQGVSRDPAGNATALVVGSEDKVEARQLQILRAVGNQWLVGDGLQEGDRLIVEGVQKARPGATVRVAISSLDSPAPLTAASN